jgi:hypothetical protein
VSTLLDKLPRICLLACLSILSLTACYWKEAKGHPGNSNLSFGYNVKSMPIFSQIGQAALSDQSAFPINNTKVAPALLCCPALR